MSGGAWLWQQEQEPTREDLEATKPMTGAPQPDVPARRAMVARLRDRRLARADEIAAEWLMNEDPY